MGFLKIVFADYLLGLFSLKKNVNIQLWVHNVGPLTPDVTNCPDGLVTLKSVWHAGLNLSENLNKDVKESRQKLNEKWKILMSIKVEKQAIALG